MKRIWIAIAIVSVCGAGIVASRLARADGLEPDVAARIAELVKNEDLTGLIKLWEEKGNDHDMYVMPAVAKALLSFPREKIIAAMLEGMKSSKPFVAKYCLGVLTDLKEKGAVEYVAAKVVTTALSEDMKKEAVRLAGDLANEDFAVRTANREKLIAMGPAVEDVLKDFIKNKSIIRLVAVA
jgi:hypothetical protein